jgi:KDO2-lipid IV(A) lauroyltransferase
MDIRNHLEYILVKVLLSVCRILPENAVYALFKGLSLLLYALLVPRRKLALRNLEIAFPEKSRRERGRLARNSFVNLSESIAFNALLMTGRIDNERLLSCVEVEDEERLRAAAEWAKQGLLVFSAHIGNWELMPNFAALKTGTPIHVIARETSNPLLEKHIVTPLRERFGVRIFFKKNALLKIMQATRKGEIAGLLIDQRMNIRQGILVPFFGRDAGTVTTPALLQIRFGIQTLPVFMIKTGRMSHKLLIGEPVEWTDNGKPMEEQVAELTHIHQKIMEEVIRQYPDQWFWVHNRWGLKKGER